MGRSAELKCPQQKAKFLVGFLGVDANVQDSLTEVSAYANKYDIPFPILIDSQQKVADLLGAERTPEVFVLDQNRVVRYQGRIDDQYGISIQKAEAKQAEMLAAVDAGADAGRAGARG